MNDGDMWFLGFLMGIILVMAAGMLTLGSSTEGILCTFVSAVYDVKDVMIDGVCYVQVEDVVEPLSNFVNLPLR